MTTGALGSGAIATAVAEALSLALSEAALEEKDSECAEGKSPMAPPDVVAGGS
jgi:hypothetical protein